MHHLVWKCSLPRVAARRRLDLIPGVLELNGALGALDPASGSHVIGSACSKALLEGEMPHPDVRERSLAHMLGVVEAPPLKKDRACAMRKSQRGLLAIVTMQRAAEQASRPVVCAAFRTSRRRVALRGALDWLRIWCAIRRPALQPPLVVDSGPQLPRSDPLVDRGRVLGRRRLEPLADRSVMRRVFNEADSPQEGVRAVAQQLRQGAARLESAARAAVDDMVEAEVVLDCLPSPRAACKFAGVAQTQGDIVFWERRKRELEADAADEAVRYTRRCEASANAFVALWLSWGASAARKRQAKAAAKAAVGASRLIVTAEAKEARRAAAQARAVARKEERQRVRAALSRSPPAPQVPSTPLSVWSNDAQARAAVNAALAEAHATAQRVGRKVKRCAEGIRRSVRRRLNDQDAEDGVQGETGGSGGEEIL